MGDSEHDDIDPDPEQIWKKVSTTLLHVHIYPRRPAAGQFIHVYIRSFFISFSFKLFMM